MKNFYFCFLISFLAGCIQNFAGEDVRLAFPEPPAQIRQRFGEPAWEVHFSGDSGMPRRLHAPAGASSVSIHIAPGPPVSVACYMVFEGRADLFFPAGGLFPHDADGGRLALAWEKGFAAAFLIRLEEQGYPVESFNSGRFFRETLLRGSGNAWALNEELITTTLTALSFRADKIKPLPAHPVNLPLPDGSWLPRNLLAPLVRTNEEGVCDFGYLPEGYHRYYLLDGNGKLDIQVKNAKDILYTVAGEGL
jgi:hypothetical protein